MSALSTLAAGVTGGIWKIAAVVLLAAVLVVASAGGTGWWAAASARDKAVADLAAEQAINGQLRAAVQLQNAAVESAGAAKLAADDRGAAAQKTAAVTARRLDAALAKVAAARATTCDEAMPTVDLILEAIR